MASTTTLPPMTARPIDLDALRVAAPCHEPWDAMTPVGDGQTVRACDRCAMNVYDVSAMTARDARTLIAEHEGKGRLCIRMHRRPDGTVISADCPVGLAGRRKRWMAAAAGLVAALLGGVFAFGTTHDGPSRGPVASWLGLDSGGGRTGGNVVWQGEAVMGRMCLPYEPEVQPLSPQVPEPPKDVR